jgi:hypothetical protein
MKRSQRAQRIWRDTWFLSLPPFHKLVMEFLRAHCDACGVWEFDRKQIEPKVGFGKITPAWLHPQIRGIEFATEELAIEDAEARNLDVKKVRMKELPKWSSIISTINKAPPELKDSKFAQIEIIGEKKWWLVRFVEQEHGWNQRGRHKVMLKLTEAHSIRHRAAIRALRRHGLMPIFREYYPEAEITETAPSASIDGAVKQAEQQNASQFPSWEEILAAPEGGRLPPTERRAFWVEQNHRSWPAAPDWKGALREQEMLWATRFDYTQQSGQPWPETAREKETTIELISEMLSAENENRREIGGQLRLPPEAQARVKVLLRAKEVIERK